MNNLWHLHLTIRGLPVFTEVMIGAKLEKVIIKIHKKTRVIALIIFESAQKQMMLKLARLEVANGCGKPGNL